MSVDSLDQPEYSVLFFRTSCDVGLALERHRRALRRALGGETMFDFVLSRSRAWMDRLIPKLAGQSYEAHLDIVRAQIQAEIAGAEEQMCAALQRIAGSVQPRTPGQLANELQAMCDRGHADVSAAISRFGGSNGRTRWNSRGKAALDFEHGFHGPTTCSFVRGTADLPDLVILHIGNHLKPEKDGKKGALRVYFNLRFYFFHEYLSHSLAIWQDTTFVDGYLVWAANELLFDLHRDIFSKKLIEHTLEAADESYLERTRDVFDWFEKASGQRFVSFLLEWAADEQHASDRTELEALFQLSQNAPEDQELIDKIRLAFNTPDSRATRAALWQLAKEVAGLPPPYVSRLS